jgi:sortase A
MMNATYFIGDCEVPLGVECAWQPAAQMTRASAAGKRRLVRLAAFLALAFAFWHAGQAAYIQAKAQLAQVLMHRAWEQTLTGAKAVKPWPWADTWPVARLAVPSQGVDLFVLAGADGRAMAFGPGHVYGTPEPGSAGNSVIGGHRDTHLHFLKDLRLGDEVQVQRPDGREVAYRVSDTRVADKTDLSPLAPCDGARLTLITCWPFAALRPGGPLRYVVTATAVGGS